jgi:serine/threonine-protein kinase
MGVVYEAFDPDLERTVALKSVQLTFATAPDQQERFDQRFLAEARAAASLSHPAVVIVHDVGRDPVTGRPFIAFERLFGRTLDEVVRDRGPLPWRTALGKAAQLARALHAAHERGIVHRDVKPANIMVLDDGQPKIMDFGIAKLPALELTSTGQFMGTPAYASPEQLAGEALDGRSDVFSLGAVLHFMLTARVAFDGGSIPATLALVSLRDPPPPSSHLPGLPPGVDALVAWMLAKAPGDRPADALSVAEALEDVANDRPPRHRPPRPSAGSGTLVARRTDAAALDEIEALDLEPIEASVAIATTLPAPAGGGPAPGWLDRLGRRRALVALGGLAALVLFARLLTDGKSPVSVLAPPPATLEVDFEHSLREGTLRVYVDDDLALEEPLESYVSEDLVLLKLRKGRERVSIPVAPGARVVRIEVEGGGFSGSRRISGDFASGQSRRLNVRFGGLLNRDLRVGWGS